MRKLLFILILGMCAHAQAQEPVYNQMRNNYQFRGIRVDSLMLLPKFNDTSAAAYLNGIPGALIRVNGNVYMRFNKWLLLNPATTTIDTSSLSARIDQRVKYTDTAVMLNPYLREADTSSLSFRIDSRVKYTDTSTMLLAYLRKGDTSSLSNRINLKLNISDTANMLAPYLRKVDTASLSNRINLRVRYTDTATMLLPYLRKADTASLSNRIDLKIDSLKKSSDSVYFKKSGTWYYSFRDSAGGGSNGRFGNDTATVVMAKVHNDAGSTLTNGEVVYLATSGTSSDVPSVKRAINKADSTSANTFGFVHGNIANNDTGYVVLSGKIEKLNTAAFANGDIIYLDSIAGKWTKSKPQAPYHLVYLGVVIKANAGNGSIFVKPVNGYEIEELHDVQINNRINNQIIAYSDTQKVWKNRNVWSVVDTSTWSARIDQRVRYTDTASMLSPYLRKADTASLSNRINTKLNITDTSAFLRDGDSSLYQTKFRTDTMRTNMYNQMALELNISDSNTIYQTKFRSDTARTNTYTAIAGREALLTFSTGLTRSTNTITSNLSTGVSGGQSVVGGTASGNNLTLSTTTNATKGKILFGTSTYDEANNRMGIGTTSPVNPFDVIRGTAGTMARNSFESGSFSFNGDMKVGVYTSSATSTDGAALTFAQTNLLANSRYPGFDMQYVYSATVANNAWRLNYTERSAAGAVQNYAANLFATYADGRVVINPTTVGVTSSAKLFVGHNTDAGYMLDVNGTARASQFILRALNNAPASATATGTTGEIRIVNGFIYVCVATNTWQRAALTTW